MKTNMDTFEERFEEEVGKLGLFLLAEPRCEENRIKAADFNKIQEYRKKKLLSFIRAELILQLGEVEDHINNDCYQTHLDGYGNGEPFIELKDIESYLADKKKELNLGEGK